MRWILYALSLIAVAFSVFCMIEKHRRRKRRNVIYMIMSRGVPLGVLRGGGLFFAAMLSVFLTFRPRDRYSIVFFAVVTVLFLVTEILWFRIRAVFDEHSLVRYSLFGKTTYHLADVVGYRKRTRRYGMVYETTIYIYFGKQELAFYELDANLTTLMTLMESVYEQHHHGRHLPEIKKPK